MFDANVCQGTIVNWDNMDHVVTQARGKAFQKLF